jgi:hypothetical protein
MAPGTALDTGGASHRRRPLNPDLSAEEHVTPVDAAYRHENPIPAYAKLGGQLHAHLADLLGRQFLIMF